MKRLYRSQTDRKLTGVCGGIAHYFDLDPTMVRLAALLIILLTGLFPGVIIYAIAALITPEEPHHA